MNKKELFSAMSQGTVVITPNNRLALLLLDAYCESQSETVMKKPCCLPWQAFLTQLYNEEHGKKPLLLNSRQLRHLWQSVLPKESGAGLLEEVMEAYRRCVCWGLDFNHSAFSLTKAGQAFQIWCQKMTAVLEKISAITEHHLVDYFLQHPPRTPDGLIWYCFDEQTPAQINFDRLMIEKGCAVSHVDLISESSEVCLYAAKDREDELLQVLAFIQQSLERGDRRIALVVPDLQSRADQLKRLLQQQTPPLHFNISLGDALSDFALAAHALQWLFLNPEKFSQDQVRLLLYSPFIAGAKTEWLSRSDLLQNPLLFQDCGIAREDFLKNLDKTPLLRACIAGLKSWPETASVTEWLELFAERLMCLGFPGEYSFNSAAYQCHQRFMLLFDEFRTLSLVQSQMSVDEALHAFKTLVETTLFQPEKSVASVQVLGLLEASGCEFDSLWVLGMTDECLPAKITLSAFIPGFLQKEQQMPHASFLREWQLADSMIERFKKSANRVVFSYPKMVEDRLQLPSPLIENLSAWDHLDRQVVQVPEYLEWYEEKSLYPVRQGETVSGGTALLAAQAKCPFKAFAAHRLHLKKGIRQEEGLSALDRGKIIHKVMELVWQSLKTHLNLLNMPAAELEHIVSAAIEESLKPYKGQASFGKIFQETESIRLKQLVSQAMEWEKKRLPFEVEALEKTFSMVLAGIEFNLRVDRLDRDENGQKMVIDYKTSLPQSSPWKEERPKEPQLLLYALLDEKINQLFFVGLKEGAVGLKGVAEKDWDEDYRERWYKQLTALAEEFMQGQCLPLPLSPSVCQQCDYQSLCRIE